MHYLDQRRDAELTSAGRKMDKPENKKPADNGPPSLSYGDVIKNERPAPSPSKPEPTHLTFEGIDVPPPKRSAGAATVPGGGDAPAQPAPSAPAAGKGDAPRETAPQASASPQRDAPPAEKTPQAGAPGDQADNTKRANEPRVDSPDKSNRAPLDPQKDTSDGFKKTLGDYADRMRQDYKDTPWLSGDQISQMQKDVEKNMSQIAKNLERPEVKAHLQGTPEQEMQRINAAMRNILEGGGSKTSVSRAGLVASMSARLADPKTFENQGLSNTCSPETLQASMVATRGADQVEAAASVLNKGGAYVGTGADRRWVDVDKRSRESGLENVDPWNKTEYGAQPHRDLGGQLLDGLYGQAAADLKTDREHKLYQNTSGKFGMPSDQSYKFVAANVKNDERFPKAETDEALLKVTKQQDGTSREDFVRSGPPSNPEDEVALRKLVTGQPGGLFMSKEMAGVLGSQSKGFTIVDSPKDLENKVRDYQQQTGFSGSMKVDGNYYRAADGASPVTNSPDVSSLSNQPRFPGFAHAVVVGINGADYSAGALQGGALTVDNVWGGDAQKKFAGFTPEMIYESSTPYSFLCRKF